MTAKELFDKMLQENEECTSTEMMIEFARLHVKQALLMASITRRNGFYDSSKEESEIINSYPLSRIR